MRRLFVLVLMILTVGIATQSSLEGRPQDYDCSYYCLAAGGEGSEDLGVCCGIYSESYCCYWEHLNCLERVESCSQYHEGCWCLEVPTWGYCSNCRYGDDVPNRYCVCHSH